MIKNTKFKLEETIENLEKSLRGIGYSIIDKNDFGIVYIKNNGVPVFQLKELAIVTNNHIINTKYKFKTVRLSNNYIIGKDSQDNIRIYTNGTEKPMILQQ